MSDTTKTKESTQHLDALGRVIEVGQCIAYSDHNEIEIGVVNKINPKMVRVTKRSRWGRNKFSNINKRPEQCVVVEGPHVTMYMIKNS
jgi:hypothetical protein